MERTTQRYRGGHLAVVVDCADLDRAAEFWSAALGYVPAAGHDPYLPLVPADGIGVEVLLQRVPESKHAKSRLHLDLRARDLGRELERVLALGARQLTSEPITEAGWRWHVLADLDDNEFCVLQPPESYWG
jgi:predicted enzyme related to lactoylglutathione lyase